MNPSCTVGTGGEQLSSAPVHGEPLSDPALHKCRGAEEMWADAAELALSIPSVHDMQGRLQKQHRVGAGMLPLNRIWGSPPSRPP